MLKIFFTLLMVSVCSLAFAQNYTGTYTIPTSRGVITLSLTQHQNGVSGKLVGDDGITFQLEGKFEGGKVSGYLLKPNKQGDQFELVAMVELHLEGQQLAFTLIPLDAQGNPNHQAATGATYQKQREGFMAKQPSSKGNPPMGTSPVAPSGGFSGAFQGEIAGAATTLTLQQNGNQLSGKADAGGYVYTVQGTVSGQSAKGTLHDPTAGGQIPFEAALTGDGLTLTMLIPDQFTGQSQRLDFHFRRLGASPGAAGTTPGQTIPRPQTMDSPSGNYPPASPPAETQTAQLVVGQQYAPGTRVNIASAGVSFVLPAEWLGGMKQGSRAFLMGSNTRAGLGILIPYPQYNPQSVMQELSGPQDFGQGVVLQPTGAPRQEGNRLWFDYAGGAFVGHALVVPGSHNNAVVIFFGGPAQDSHYLQQLIREIAAGVRFSAPQAGAEVQQWRQLLSGMMLKRMSSYYSGSFDGSYVGGSSEETLHLCSDGSFAYSGSSTVAGDAGAGAVSGYSGGSGAETGRWELQALGGQVLLILKYTNGTQSEHVITYDGEKTFLDGQRVYRVQSDRCY